MSDDAPHHKKVAKMPDWVALAGILIHKDIESTNHFNPRLNYYWLWGIQPAGVFLMNDGISPRVTVINNTIVTQNNNNPS